MHSLVAGIIFVLLVQQSMAQSAAADFTAIQKIPYSPVKNQANTGTCWSFSTTSLVESQTMKNGLGDIDLSEMYTVRNIYTEKARNYILRQGAAQFGPGGLGHDVIRAMATYGAMPESAYSGLLLGVKQHDHSKMDTKLKVYLDSLLKNRPLPVDWMKGFQLILDDYLGKPPETFFYKEKTYTPKTFATEVLRFNPDDYVNITSYTHHPFYAPFILEAPDNFLNGSYYNVPLEEMVSITVKAVESGYSIMWDADVSNKFFRQAQGLAVQLADDKNIPKELSVDAQEVTWSQAMRQQLYENLTTQDDHLMHLVGIERSKGGKRFFVVKNSWGTVGPYQGFINVSEAYFAINTVSMVVPRAALDASLKAKLGLR